jgi:hypothetical protein
MGGEQDCEAASPVDSPPTHLRLTSAHLVHSRIRWWMQIKAASSSTQKVVLVLCQGSCSLSRHAKPKLEL